ncbi:hypothetical protein EVJ58_g5373 [Rhodofomes roseus]|uniref:Mitochondrial import inner membrane translocase subunit TIM54 n=1 Tax=Rhodofomes roseus TaxID=34475 RepID=A0A4Y9YCM0_9APHY|nr:hypothetical protein EVJ58_g5373 [Rhodofomes roseus]
MSKQAGDSVFPQPKLQLTGVKAALQYTGIPPSWLDKRPSLPSRNWLIFLGVTSTIAGYYIYDRRKCKEIRKEYVDKVKNLADVPLHSLDYPRKVTVYGSKWPADEDYDRGMKYFRKYVKPILVAAAIDFEMINGRRHGDLARRIADDIKKRRRLELGLDQPPIVLPHHSPEDQRRRELEGGIVIVGRPTFKEFMAGLKRGWTERLEIVDREEMLSQDLENDGKFDESELETNVVSDGPDLDGEPIPTTSRLPSSKSFPAFTPPHLQGPSPSSTAKASEQSTIPASMNTPPARIPPMPPVLLVHFVDYIGFSQIPHMIWEFFNQRHKAQSGAEAAYRLVKDVTRPFNAPPEEELSRLAAEAESQGEPDPSQPHLSEPSLADLDFDKDVELSYKKSYVRDFTDVITKARQEYYEKLPARLETARALAWGTREPTKEEANYPPPTEVELRAERMKKELRWRADEEGWDIIRPGKPVAWDERLRDVLKVFVDPPSETRSGQAKEEEAK